MTAKKKTDAPNPVGRPQTPPVNAFAKYIQERGLTHPEVAADLDLARGYVIYLSTGRRLPALSLAWQIEQWSKSAVPMQSWCTQPAFRTHCKVARG